MSVAALTDLWRMGAVALAELISSKQTSSQEVIEAHLRRIERVNPSINAITCVLAEQALDAAKAADRAVHAGHELPRFHGVPFTVKDNLDLVGTPTTMGFKVLADSYPTADAPAVERLRAAGAVPIARTNLPTLGMRLHTDSELHGPTLNPWDRARTPGGSSGGDAAAVATGMTPMGLGNDTGGSLRWPAQCCGVATLKPTLGRIPRASSVEPAHPPIGTQLMGVNGPLARSVADLRAAFEVLAGPTWRDPWSVPAPLRGPEPVTPMHVALVLDPAGQGIARPVQEGVRSAGRALSDAGYIVEEVEPPSIDQAAKVALDMLNPEWHLLWQFASSGAEAGTALVMAALFGAVGEPDALTTTLSYMTRESLMQEWGRFQESFALIVAPVSTNVPFTVGKDLSAAGVVEIHRAMRMAHAINALALPAVALPVGVEDGLPQSVQVIGPRFREDLCLDAAQAVEDRLGAITPVDPA